MPIPARFFMELDSCSFFEASLDAGVGRTLSCKGGGYME